MNYPFSEKCLLDFQKMTFIEQTSVDQYWSKVCGVIFEVDK